MNKLRVFLIFAVALLLVAGVTTAWAAAPTPTNTCIGLSPNPVAQNASSTATGTTVEQPGSCSGSPSPQSTAGLGEIGIHIFPHECKSLTTCDLTTSTCVNDPTKSCTTNPSSACFPGLGPPLDDGTPDANGQFSTAADTTVVGSFAYHANYLGKGDGFGNSTSPCLDLVVNNGECPASGLTIVATLAGGPGCPASGTNTWTYRITVTNCGGVDISNVTAQGGSNGWTTNAPGLSPDKGTAGIRKINKLNSTILWLIGAMPAGSVANLDVTLTGTIKSGSGTPNGTLFFLNGPWSAINGDTTLKTDYTGRVTLVKESSGTCPI